MKLMATEFDATEFVDEDLQRTRHNPFQTPPMQPAPDDPQRAPTREEVDSRLTELHAKLASLKLEQTEIERERSAFEETRRRQVEFTTGREELIRDLSRGLQLLQEKEFATRRDAEQMAKALQDLKDALAKLQAIQDAAWSRENLSSELSRAMGLVDHARMEWNSARLKFPVLSANPETGELPSPASAPRTASTLQDLAFFEIARVGLALTWPLALAALAIFSVLLLRR
jgi:hypothetical protein